MKPKIFVRYPQGAAGQFISSLIFSLVTPITQQNKNGAGHEHDQLISLWHNFVPQYHNNEFNEMSTEYVNLKDSIKYFQENYRFEDEKSPYPLFVVNTHVINPDPLILAFENSKLINIQVQDSERDQLAYNWVIKYLLPLGWPESAYLTLKVFCEHYPEKLLDSTILEKENLKLLTYLHRFTQEKKIKRRNDYNLGNGYDYLEIQFQEILNKNLINRIDEIADYIGITLTDERKQNAITLINEYADAQTVCPWTLSINDF